MENLRTYSNERIIRTSTDYQRGELQTFDWDLRLMGVKGARGIGKTTLLLQHLKLTHGLVNEALYVSLDDIYFSDNRLVDVVQNFNRDGGKFLYVDEVHKYPDWAIEIKNIYDRYPNLNVVFTGSAMLEIQKANADLSRRAIIFDMQGLSFRQFAELKHNITLPCITLRDILFKGNEVIASISQEISPYPLFREYLRSGYYPFFTEGDKWFYDRLMAIVRVVVEIDLLFVQNIDIQNIRKIYKLLLLLSTSPPFTPNIQRLSERTGISRNSLVQYLYYLEEADILSLLQTSSKGMRRLQKPDKVYLENPNLLYAFGGENIQLGSLRETFVLNQLKVKHQVNFPDKGDFFVDDTYTLEVGGPSKGTSQISGVENAYIIADNWDFVVGNKIPIWLFGLLY